MSEYEGNGAQAVTTEDNEEVLNAIDPNVEAASPSLGAVAAVGQEDLGEAVQGLTPADVPEYNPRTALETSGAIAAADSILPERVNSLMPPATCIGRIEREDIDEANR